MRGVRVRENGARALLAIASALGAAWCFELALPSLERLVHTRGERTARASLDQRSRAEVLRDARADGSDVVRDVVPAGLLEEASGGTLRSKIAISGREWVALSSIANARTVLCNEGSGWIEFESDKHGFRNSSERWGAPVDVALLGDSFTYGNCVAGNATIAGRLGSTHTTLNLGMVGTGPLFQLAILREYATQVRPTVLIWIHFENDLGAWDLQREKRSPILMRYLDPAFSQGLAARPPQLDSLLREAMRDLEMRQPVGTLPSARLLDALLLSGLRERIRTVRDEMHPRPRRVDPEALALFVRIAARAKDLVASWDGELVLAYLPRERFFDRSISQDHRPAQVLEVGRSLGLVALDLGAVIDAQPNPRAMFAGAVDTGPMHLNERGYAVVAEALRGLLTSR